jgi:hypothetical protein
MSIKSIFIHAAILDKCKDRILQYLNIIQESNLLNHNDSINICFIGIEEFPIKENDLKNYYFKKNIRLIKLSSELHDYELPTLEFLYQFCRNNRDHNVLYLHTKNVGKEINNCIEDQIKYMLFFNIVKWEKCIKILEKYSTCGVDLRSVPTIHYSGNFWWAKSAYISSLPSPNDFNNLDNYPNPLNSLRHNQEFWICSDKNENNHYTLCDCNINCYERHIHRYPEEKYK